MNYPIDCTKTEDKIKFCWRSIEKLRLWHNTEGQSRTLESFREWQKKEHKPREKQIFAELNGLRDQQQISEVGSVEEKEEMDLKSAIKLAGTNETKWDASITLMG